MDLTSSKDYHKRHRVCEIHSKTSMVIVSGIQQRFCQQCSRFHLLAEFDDGKRSCRRRLAGHNQRRRKPSFYFLPGRRHKVLHTSQGNKCVENSLVLPEAFPSGRLVKFKDESSCSIISSSSSRIYQWKPVSSSSSEESSIWDIHEASRSTCALSLLSAKSQQVSANQNKPNHMGSPLMDSSKSSSSYIKGSSTVDLLQLSLHLQRIEQQRNFSEVKHEYKDLYFPDS